jgi:DNA polymerase-3 subunit epsilon
MNKKEKLVYFDVETTGLPTHRNLIPTMLDNQPHIVQLSWIIVETINPNYKELHMELNNELDNTEIKTELDFDKSSEAWENNVQYYNEEEEEEEEKEENQCDISDVESDAEWLDYEIKKNDKRTRKYTEKDYIIKMPPGVSIPQSSTDIHKITNEISRDKGVNIDVVLKEFIEDISDANVVGAHNLSFDKQMILIEASRLNLYGETAVSLKKIKKYCTMMNGINLCKIPIYLKHSDKYAYKWPKLSELHRCLFDEDVDENVVLHNAIEDCRVGVKCYLKMHNII